MSFQSVPNARLHRVHALPKNIFRIFPDNNNCFRWENLNSCIKKMPGQLKKAEKDVF